MKTALYGIAASLLLCGAAIAQDGSLDFDADNAQPARAARPYYSERQLSARQAIHARAAWKAAQRQMRIETYKRYGYSPSRPPASTMAMMGSNATWIGPVVHYNLPGIFYFQTVGLPY